MARKKLNKRDLAASLQWRYLLLDVKDEYVPIGGGTLLIFFLLLALVTASIGPGNIYMFGIEFVIPGDWSWSVFWLKSCVFVVGSGMLLHTLADVGVSVSEYLDQRAVKQKRFIPLGTER